MRPLTLDAPTDGHNEGRFIRSRVAEALSSDCTSPCVPLNLFGGPGSITQDQVDYISYTGTAKTTFTQKSVQVNVSNNDIYELPAGNLGVAMGWEHRNDLVVTSKIRLPRWGHHR
ncbi:MAG: hypothetical protein CM1200mP9_08240 [Gammaproteobacteria bacterium]|nr:MAG: hypothetical protein CM1200mP9_08240 [Gammaproteobacteria bacterium]